MDARASKKALYRAKLKDSAQKREKRIDSPLVRYNEHDQPVCRVCNVILKSESLWAAHQVSRQHHEAIKNVKATAGLTRSSDVKPVPSTELHQPKSEPLKPQSSAGLPTDFFDNHDTKRQKTGLGTGGKSKSIAPQASAKIVDSGSVSRTYGNAEASTPVPPTKVADLENETSVISDDVIKAQGKSEVEPFVQISHTSTKIGDLEVKQVKGTLPEGFFDNKDADLRARGIEPVKLDIKDEYKEFEKVIQEDLKEVDNRLEEEEFDAAETIEEAETVDQKSYRERVEMLKKRQMELKAARIAGRKETQVGEEETDDEESSSSDEDDEENFAVDWRAKHL